MTKKLFTLLFFAIIGMCSSFSMSRERAREEADFLTDKMAYELRLTEAQWADVYEINYDYFRALEHLGRSYVRESQLRDTKLRYVLTLAQWERYRGIHYFMVPVRAGVRDWIFSIYDHYRRNHFYYDSRHIVDVYRGSHRKHYDFYQQRYQPRYRQVAPVKGHQSHHFSTPQPAPEVQAPANRHYEQGHTSTGNNANQHSGRSGRSGKSTLLPGGARR